MVGIAISIIIKRLDIEFTNNVVFSSRKSICMENIPFKLFSITNSKSYITLMIAIPRNFPTIIKIAGVRDILSALLSSFDIILGQLV